MNSSQAIYFAGGLQSSEVGMEITVILPLILTTICLVGFTGNLLLIAILLRDYREGKCSAVNCFVINIGATDLLLILFCIPVQIVTYAKQSWVFGNFVCKTTEWFLHSCLIVKSITLAAISQARYRHVVTPPKFISFNKKYVFIILFLIWTFSVLLPLPHLIFTHLELKQESMFEKKSEGLYCNIDVPEYASNFMNVYSKLYPLLVYIFPMFITFFCYMRALRRRKERRNRVPNPRIMSRKITSMLMSISLAFEAMWLPKWIVWIWARHSSFGALQPPTALMVLAQVILFLNCTLNPGVFLAVSDEFREGFKNIWMLLRCRKCVGTSHSRAGENGSDMVTSTIQSLQDLQTPSALHPLQESISKDEKILPDVEHFWQDRRNTTAGEDNDPMPWEHQA
ncbi:G-protein coupled receptor 151-like [Bombina bombina]|uniref:G-protein coupled receptor 151-like n=1 Tax=Bombina bombina TaxID=8345 RepID=UPI00235AECEE|nr:G-protein coupled receptor 151-like [Bombina bombina]